MANPFDEVPYPGFPFPESHPDRLATIATLFGMTPPLLESCRILELGCGDGSNLIPMAFGLPQSQWLGVDLAERPIQKGPLRKVYTQTLALREAESHGNQIRSIAATQFQNPAGFKQRRRHSKQRGDGC